MAARRPIRSSRAEMTGRSDPRRSPDVLEYEGEQRFRKPGDSARRPGHVGRPAIPQVRAAGAARCRKSARRVRHRTGRSSRIGRGWCPSATGVDGSVSRLTWRGIAVPDHSEAHSRRVWRRSCSGGFGTGSAAVFWSTSPGADTDRSPGHEDAGEENGRCADDPFHLLRFVGVDGMPGQRDHAGDNGTSEKHSSEPQTQVGPGEMALVAREGGVLCEEMDVCNRRRGLVSRGTVKGAAACPVGFGGPHLGGDWALVAGCGHRRSFTRFLECSGGACPNHRPEPRTTSRSDWG